MAWEEQFPDYTNHWREAGGLVNLQLKQDVADFGMI